MTRIGSVEIALAFALLAALVPAAPAAAQEKEKPAAAQEEDLVWPSPLDPGKFEFTYTILPFGTDRAEFFKVLRQRFEQQLMPVLKGTLEARQRDVLKAQMERDLAAVEKTWTEFAGQDTGYAVSVIAGEFRHNAGEAVVKYTYGENAAYFLFSGGALWQIYLCVEPDTPFDELVKRLTGLYERPPAEMAWENPEEMAGLNSAIWRDSAFELTAEATPGLFRCNTLRWTYLPAQDGIEIRRAAAEVMDTGGSTVNALLDQVTRDSAGDVDDVLDEVLDKK